MTTGQDDPIAKDAMTEVRLHLAAGSDIDLAEAVEAIDSLDATANPVLKLDQLRKEVERRIIQHGTAVKEPQQPDRSDDVRSADIPSPAQSSADRPTSEPPASPVNMTSPAGPDEYTNQRIRFQMIAAEIPGADEQSLAALLAETAMLTKLPAVERDWMSDQIEAEMRRRYQLSVIG